MQGSLAFRFEAPTSAKLNIGMLHCRQEQRAVVEVDFVLFKRVLTPLQAGSFILYSFPEKANAVALVRGAETQA